MAPAADNRGALQDLGQKLENIYPPNAISEEEGSAVAFHSFPDSLSQELHYKSSIRDTCACHHP